MGLKWIGDGRDGWMGWLLPGGEGGLELIDEWKKEKNNT
jgi:hypothetical protein